MKKLFNLVMAVCMILSMLILPANAGYVSDHPLTMDELEALKQKPEVYMNTPCSGGNGICQMCAQGWAYVFDINTGRDITKEYRFGCCWQCDNCYSVMVTSGDPMAGTIIGNYVVTPCDHDLQMSVVQYVYVNPRDIHRCESVHLSGYQFHNSHL